MDKEEEQVKQENSINGDAAAGKPEHHPSLNGTAGTNLLLKFLM